MCAVLRRGKQPQEPGHQHVSRHARAVVVDHDDTAIDREAYRACAGIAGVLHEFSDPDVVVIAVPLGLHQTEREETPDAVDIVVIVRRWVPQGQGLELAVHRSILDRSAGGVDSAVAVS